MKKICVAGLNPAWQKTLIFKSFKRGGINRAESLQRVASGKGINFARAVKTWDVADVTLYQFLGGDTGKAIRKMLWDEKISNISVEIAEETRTCTTIVSQEDSNTTEVIEPSPEVSPYQVAELYEYFLAGLQTSDAIAICGTYPAGINEYVYAKLMDAARKLGKFILVDTYKHVDDALTAGVNMLKINRDELFALTQTDGISDAFHACFDKFKMDCLAVTDGAANAYFSDGKKLAKIAIPALPQVINPIGSGDTCSGVTLSEILAGTDPLEAFRRGLAAASANCLTPLPAFFEKQAALDLLPNFTVTEEPL